MRRFRLAIVAFGVVLIAATFAAVAVADDDDGDGAFRTEVASMLNCSACDRNVPVLTVGEDIPGTSYQFEAIPDGISIHARGGGDDGGDGDDDDDEDEDEDDNEGGRRFDLYVNHETSTVPFPFTTTSPNAFNSQNDFDNSQLSRLRIDADSLDMSRARMVIRSNENFQRFCSNYLATEKEGFDRPILFTNEEAQDVVRRRGTAWEAPGIPLNSPRAEQPGVVVAYDVRSGRKRVIYGMGRHDHENSTAIPLPDSGKLVVLSGDDTFMTAPVTGRSEAWSQLYSYIADDTNDVWRDRGDLWAFVSDNPSYQNYYDFGPNDTADITGHWVKVPKQIAVGKKANGMELTSADFAATSMPAPPTGVSSPPPDGPMWVLDQWGNPAHNTAGPGGTGANVFRFVRVEDVAYDKRPGMSNVVYIIDSGLGTTGASADRKSTNGRIWRMVLDKNDPTKVLSFRVLVEGDDFPVKTLNEIHQPDNVETTANGSLLIQEDPGSSQQFVFGDRGLPNATTARIWKVNLNAGTVAAIDASKAAVASVDQSLDENANSTAAPVDVDPQPDPAGTTPLSPGRWGAWESSGIVDASSVLGPGWFFTAIQAHTYWVESAPGPGYTFKREGGQLIAIRIPGA